MSLLGTLLLAFCLHSATADCIAKKFENIVGHTACIKPDSYSIIRKGMSDEDKEVIVNLHNKYRAEQPAANMQKMIWDDEIAAIAEKWADNCEFKHDKRVLRSIPGRFMLGQNLAIGYKNWENAFLSWYNEVELFTYGSASNNFRAVGHYTQVVWAKSARVGCAFAECSNLAEEYFTGKFYVCNYGQAGNKGNAERVSRPYKTMKYSKCEDCPNTCNNEGLCDCGGKVCLNGGSLDLNTCTCQCSKPYHVPGICHLDCEKAEDEPLCGTYWPRAACTRYTKVFENCPNMCGSCPHGGVRFSVTKLENSTEDSNATKIFTQQATQLPPTVSSSIPPETTTKSETYISTSDLATIETPAKSNTLRRGSTVRQYHRRPSIGVVEHIYNRIPTTRTRTRTRARTRTYIRRKSSNYNE